MPGSTKPSALTTLVCLLKQMERKHKDRTILIVGHFTSVGDGEGRVGQLSLSSRACIVPSSL